MKKKIWITAIAGTLLFLLYLMIFRFSAEEAPESGSRSREIAKTCVETVNDIGNKKWSAEKKEQLTDNIENPIRKLAHFTEYACTGILLLIIWVQWLPVNRRMFVLLLLWIALTASLDEIHQLFVDGRSGNVKDVLLDTFGGFAGIMAAILCRSVFDKIKNKKAFKKKSRA